MTGIALMDFRGTDKNNWTQDQMYIVLDSVRWERVDELTAVASPNSFAQNGDMYSAGWAVNTVDYDLEGDKIRLRVMLACRGVDSRLMRVGYQATALGKQKET